MAGIKKNEILEEIKESTKEILDAIQDSLNALQEQLNLLSQIEKKKEDKTQLKSEIEETSKYPIPTEYKDIVDTILNPEFGIEINPRGDAPLFEFVILVPKKYSNASSEYWDVYQSDKRMKVISYAEGITGVRDWTERVYNNFNEETKSLITLDRASLKGV